VPFCDFLLDGASETTTEPTPLRDSMALTGARLCRNEASALSGCIEERGTTRRLHVAMCASRSGKKAHEF
jgi:hypothetical protein